MQILVLPPALNLAAISDKGWLSSGEEEGRVEDGWGGRRRGRGRIGGIGEGCGGGGRRGVDS